MGQAHVSRKDGGIGEVHHHTMAPFTHPTLATRGQMPGGVRAFSPQGTLIIPLCGPGYVTAPWHRKALKLSLNVASNACTPI